MESIIRDINLAESGERKIEWVKRNCDLLRMLEEEFSKTKPFAGKKVALSVHLEAKTAYLCKVLKAGGAEMYVTGSNPLSTQDDVAAALVKAGLNVYAWYNATPEEYEAHIRKVLEVGPNIIIDDGGDLVHMMHTEFVDLIPNVSVDAKRQQQVLFVLKLWIRKVNYSSRWFVLTMRTVSTYLTIVMVPVSPYGMVLTVQPILS